MFIKLPKHLLGITKIKSRNKVILEKESIKVRITQKIGKETRNSYRRNEEISGRKAHTNTRKINSNVSMVTDVFLDQKRVNVR